MKLRPAIAISFFLAGCASSVSAPPQPTPAAISATIVALAEISADPVDAWRAGVYAVRSSCHAYLNQAATRSAELSIARSGIGMAGAGATGFLAAASNPMGAAAAGAVAALVQSFLSTYQSSGAMPYTGATTTLVENALDAEEAAVEQQPPTSIAQAATYVDDMWWLCSPGGYAQLMMRSALTAQVTATTPGLKPRFGGSPADRPRVLINGQ